MSVKQVLDSLGVSPSATAEGTVHVRISLHNAAQLKDLLDMGLSPQQRAHHAEALLHGIPTPNGAQAVALTHRLIQHVIGTADLSASDHAQLAAAFPITAHVTTQPSADSPTPPATDTPMAGDTPQPQGRSSSPTGPPMQVSSVWDVSTPDGSLRVIALPNGIELLDGGCVVARSTPLSFTCSTLTRVGAPPAGFAGDINILGTAGAPQPTPPASPPQLGQAVAGAAGICVANGVAGEGGQQGAPGQQGTAGTAGAAGNDGTPSALASISITDSITLDQASTKALVIATQSGPGGAGGTGGPGSAGQQGGAGGNGATCDCTGNAGGSAGPGGKGGTGGTAGDGGNGVDAAGNISVLLPTGTSTALIQPLPSPAPPGSPGSPGLGGPGGAPGSPGSPGKNNPAGPPAWSGPTGDAGSPGNPGARTGTSAQITVTVAPATASGQTP